MSFCAASWNHPDISQFGEKVAILETASVTVSKMNTRFLVMRDGHAHSVESTINTCLEATPIAMVYVYSLSIRLKSTLQV